MYTNSHYISEDTTAINYLSFMSAGDALTAIEALGETTGFALTSEALRRMARIIAPTPPQDPIFYDIQIDVHYSIPESHHR